MKVLDTLYSRLWLLRELRDTSHCYASGLTDLCVALGERPDRESARGVVNRCLWLLERADLAEWRQETPEERDGEARPPRKFWTLTARGQDLLKGFERIDAALIDKADDGTSDPA